MAQGPLTRAVALALKDAPLLPQDAAGKALVRRYAAAIDADPTPEVLADLGPKLLAALTALGLTPAGRGAKGGGQGGAVAGKLDELRARREQRARAD
ncbi:terminase small subunit [Micromonospora carbonacea]|uniref:terminase small subunit n=1 Tax=Micromonospora carbonacea TaxID=47853 RepID=UPI0037199709